MIKVPLIENAIWSNKGFYDSDQRSKTYNRFVFLEIGTKDSSYRLNFNYIIPTFRSCKRLDRNRINVDRRTVPRKQQLIAGTINMFFFFMCDD